MMPDKDTIEKLIDPLVEAQALEIVDVFIKGSRAQPLIQIYVDKDGGVSINECARLSRKISDLLDIEFADFTQYRLEISSPGADRPLRTKRDFQRNVGREACIIRLVDNKEYATEGKIVSADGHRVILDVKGCELSVELIDIHKATIRMKW